MASTSTAFTAKPKDKFAVSMYMANADGFGASIAQGSNPPLCVAGELNVRAPLIDSLANYILGISVGATITGDSFAMTKLGLEIMLPSFN